jgi:hypothetical protein
MPSGTNAGHDEKAILTFIEINAKNCQKRHALTMGYPSVCRLIRAPFDRVAIEGDNPR